MIQKVEGAQKATVKWFDAREGKQFGFLTVEGVEGDVFFHFSDGHAIVIDDDTNEEIVFMTHWLAVAADLTEEKMRFPKEGDQLLVMLTSNRKGPKASPWGFQWHLDRAIRRQTEAAYKLRQQELAVAA